MVFVEMKLCKLLDLIYLLKELFTVNRINSIAFYLYGFTLLVKLPLPFNYYR